MWEAAEDPAATDYDGGRRLRSIASPDDYSFQDMILTGVSRTFALTIPQLPDDLRVAVTNAYLLCRIADTIEDDAGLSTTRKEHFHHSFLQAVRTGTGTEFFADDLQPELHAGVLDGERELVRESPRVVRVTQSLDERQRAAMLRCVSTMSRGMARFERNRSPHGLANLADLERYCYYVAGVVGEMLTELFCDHSEEIDDRRDRLTACAVQFGQGLQMTNILKDVWDDLARGTCWLPREVFEHEGYDLRELSPGSRHPGYAAGMRRLVGVAHASLRDALRYTLAVPSHETGIRRFLLWAIGLAILTLRKVHDRPYFSSGSEVKVSRRTVAGIIATTNAFAKSDTALSALFAVAARGLPLERRPDTGAESAKEPSLLRSEH